MLKNYKQLGLIARVTEKLVLFFMVLFANTLHSQITTFPWVETFEDVSTTRASWTQVYEVNAMSWTFATSPSTGSHVGFTGAYQGTKFANYPGNSHVFDRTKLVSPVLDLSGLTTPKINFYFRNPFWDPDQNWLRIFYRISETDPWVQIAEFHSDVRTWTSSGDIFIPNTAYQIAIDCETDYGYSTTVDAFSISDATLGIDENAKAAFKYYPNPVENVLNFKSNEAVDYVKIYNLLGQKVLETKVGENSGSLDVSSLTRGNYVIETTSEGKKQTFKFLKK